MKTSFSLSLRFPLLLAGGLLLASRSGWAQAAVAIPIAEQLSRNQLKSQGLTDGQMLEENGLHATMKAIDTEIKRVSEATTALHDTWYSSLLTISAGVRDFRRVQEMYSQQKNMIAAVSQLLPELRRSSLTPNEVLAASTTLEQILRENVGLLSELASILTRNKAKLTDPERLEFINHLADRLGEQQNLLQYYGSKCRALMQFHNQQAADQAAVLSLMGKK